MLYHNLKHKNFKQSYTDNIIAVLGPTNTGKTHYAIEQMLKYKSGMIGCPLRLLAREIYDKLVKKKGILNIALITGEERIIPHTAKYFVCTVEAMPRNLNLDFVAIDEVQLSAHSERGHVFTDKLLNVRGKIETILLGSENLEILLKKIFPNIFIKKMKRFSNIEYVGNLKLSRIPPRSAIVTFSVNEVYEIAELVKRRHGGTAVVLGALSPKTRNAQVELYESGEVDYLVATDAIGMGLNMDISHVAFARLTKFDGKITRPLTFSEVAQVAGRAGRYKKDGTFGSTLGCDGFTPSMINAIETHSFPEIKSVLWRNSNLDFSSIKRLIRSLGVRSNKPYFIMSPEAEDEKLLKVISNKLGETNNLELLWEVCSIPDYGKNFDDSHAHLLENIYRLIRENGEIPEIWSKNNLDNLNNIKGELDLLAKRLANVRTWNYIFNKSDWVENSYELSSRAKYIENRLSDALHKGLVERFVDYKMARFSKHLKVNNDLVASISDGNLVKVEGHYVGRLEGLKFVNEVSKNKEDEREILRIIRKVLSSEVSRRVKLIKDSEDNELSFDKNLNIYFNGVYLARLAKGSKLLKPKIILDSIDLLTDWDQKVLKRRFFNFLNQRINNIVVPLTNIMNKFNYGILKGIAYQLRESLGVIKIKNVKELIVNLNKEEKELLNNAGVVIGEVYIWYPISIKKDNAEFIWKLFQIYNGLKPEINYPDLDKPVDYRNIPENLLNSREFVLIGNYIYGLELIEKIVKCFKKLIKSKNIFYLNKKNIGIIEKNYSLTYEQIKNILNLLEFKKDKDNPAKYFLNNTARYKTNLLGKNKHIKNSPFSVLANI